MPRVHGQSARIYVNEFNLSGRANNLTLNIGNPAADVTAYEDLAKTAVQGKSTRGWDAAIDAWFDPDDDEIDQILWDLINSASMANPWGFYFDGPQEGGRGYEGLGGLETDNIRFPLNAAGQLVTAVRGNSGQMIGRSTKIREANVVSAVEDGNSESILTTVTNNLVISVARVIAVTGSGSITVLAEESPDDAVWNPVSGLTAHPSFTAIGADFQSVASAAGGEGPFFRHRVSAYSGFTDVTLRTAMAFVEEI